MNSETTKTNDTSAAVLVWDSEADPPPFDGMIALWRSFGDGLRQPFVSVPNQVEMDAVALKQLYLKWVFGVGEVRVHGRRLVDLFEIRPGFSCWWMTLIVEKCNFAKSPQINHAIRLMAFESWITRRKCAHVTLSSPNHELAASMRVVCAKLGLVFEWLPTTVEAEDCSLLKRLYRRLPYPFQALVWLLRYLFERYPLTGVGLRDWVRSNGQMTFFSYLFNLSPLAQTEGKFESAYWAHLPVALGCAGTKTNWLHLYVPDKFLPNAAAAAGMIRKFNDSGNGCQVHATLDSFLNVKVVFRTIRDFCHVFWKARALKPREVFASSGKIYFWPLFKKEWSQSLFGTTSMQNMLFLNLFEEAMGSIPTQSVGTYLQENQGWEVALIHCWHSAGHGRILGAPHSTVRFWDLRYFFAPETFRDRKSFPFPDQVALNGAVAKKMFLDAGYPETALVDVEALRYLQLIQVGVKSGVIDINEKDPICLLVVGDYLPKNALFQMRLLQLALQILPFQPKIIVKPHPSCPVDPSAHPGMRFSTTSEPLLSLFGKCHVVYASNMTSAAVDAYFAGIPVISILDPNSLNLSPLRGRRDVAFVTSADELADALLSVRGRPPISSHINDFFNLDAELPQWMKLLRGQTS